MPNADEIKRAIEDRSPGSPSLREIVDEYGAEAVVEAQFGPQEELCDELKASLVTTRNTGTCIKHPMVNSILHHPQMNHHMNKALRQKKEMLEEYLKERKWFGIIFIIYERPWRLDALQEYADQMTDEEYWDMVGSIWTDSENMYENRQGWHDILHCGRHRQECMMDEDERDALAALPESVKVYRGFWCEGAEGGYSWTLKRNTAVWFAHRLTLLKGQERVIEGTITRDEIIAYFNGRGEDEVVLLPENVRDQRIVSVAGETAKPMRDDVEG